jgi:hypothetical protein
LPGCNLFSDNPLSDPTPDAIDRSIIGTWTWNDVNDAGFVHIGTDDERNALLITMVEFKNDGKIETTELRGHSTQLASHRYLNLQWIQPQKAQKGYFFVEYKVRGDELEGSFLDAKAFEKAITDGSLKGEVLSPGYILPTVLIHAGQSELRKFILQNEEKLLLDAFKLKKLRLSRNSHAISAAREHIAP